MVFRSGYEASLSLTLKIVEGFLGRSLELGRKLSEICLAGGIDVLFPNWQYLGICPCADFETSTNACILNFMRSKPLEGMLYWFQISYSDPQAIFQALCIFFSLGILCGDFFLCVVLVLFCFIFF